MYKCSQSLHNLLCSSLPALSYISGLFYLSFLCERKSIDLVLKSIEFSTWDDINVHISFADI